MRLILKKINLKEETEHDINIDNYDINKFMECIRIHLKKANNIIENKVLDLDSKELYDVLNEVFEIKFYDDDLLEILSNKYKKNYKDIIVIQTNMVDKDKNSIGYIGARTKKVPDYNKRVPLFELRKITKSHDFLVLETQKYKSNINLRLQEKYENHQFINIGEDIDKNSELFEYAIELLKNKIHKSGLKRILKDLEKYINELMYQAQTITKLSESENPELKQIGLKYKNVFEQNFNEKQLIKKIK